LLRYKSRSAVTLTLSGLMERAGFPHFELLAAPKSASP
jgi:hypothetical protein